MDTQKPDVEFREVQKPRQSWKKNSTSGHYRTALNITSTRYLNAALVRPTDLNGNWLRGTYYLWSGEVNKAAAKNAISVGGGWLMSQTGQHIIAETRYANALGEIANSLYPGRNFSIKQLFDMANKGELRLPDALFRDIWDSASAEVAQRAVWGHLPVQRNLLGPPHPMTVQARVELPMVRRAGARLGSLQLATGLLRLYAGTQEEGTKATIASTAGALGVTSGLLYTAGAIRASAPLMRWGLRVSIIAEVVAMPLLIASIHEDLTSGDDVRKFIGTLNLIGIVFFPAAVLGTTTEHFIVPATQTFYDIACRDIAYMLGVPRHWVY